MSLSIIVALTNNRVIGKLNSIPWYLPADMVWFKYHTLNKVVIMGRKTFESIGSKPLLNRLNIVISRKYIAKKRNTPNLLIVKTPEKALWAVKNMYSGDFEAMVIGGGEIYNLFFSQVYRLYLTCIDMTVQGDTFFPYYKQNYWKVVFSKEYNFNISNCSYCFKIFERI